MCKYDRKKLKEKKTKKTHKTITSSLLILLLLYISDRNMMIYDFSVTLRRKKD